MSLLLTRRAGESVIITPPDGGVITVAVRDIRVDPQATWRRQVLLAISAPPGVLILRDELLTEQEDSDDGT